MRSGWLAGDAVWAARVPKKKSAMRSGSNSLMNRMYGSLFGKINIYEFALASPRLTRRARDLRKNLARYSSMAILLALRAAK